MIIKIKLPVDKDGDFLRPEYKQRKGYHIGMNKKHVINIGLSEELLERYYEDYFIALENLTTMSEPRWRRPNLNGNWGVVKCFYWKWIDFEVKDGKFQVI